MQVEVYFNLHNGMWSIKSRESGLVLGHAAAVELREVRPRVSEAGRQRVIAEGRKNVHAFLTGTLVAVDGFKPFKSRLCVGSIPQLVADLSHGATLHYNPYTGPRFTVRLAGEMTGNLVIAGRVVMRKRDVRAVEVFID